MAFLRSVATVGLFTLLSRLLGFLRDLMTATLLGAGPVADAFVVAQRLPNALRSIFAEGAMDSAFVPIYTRKRQQEAPKAVAEFVNHIFTILVLVLLPLTILAVIFMPPIVIAIAPGFADDPHRFHLAVTYSRITFAFLLLISLTALQGGLLNANGHFTPLAIAPSILNSFMIGGFVVALIFHLDAGLCGSWSIIVGGIAQIIALQFICRRYGLSMKFARPRWTADVRQFFKLVGPGVIGSGSDQINVFVSTMLASTLSSGAIAALYYADRLIQLPLGVIGGAIATALLPLLTHHIAAQEKREVAHHFSRAIEMALVFCIPVALVLALAPVPIVRILFQHGSFDPGSTKFTAEAITGYSLAVPFGILTRIFTIRFYAHENTKTPVIIGLVSIVSNALLAIALKPSLQHQGVALAISLNTIVTASLLWVLLHRGGHTKLDPATKRRLPRLCLAAAIMAFVLWSLTPVSQELGMKLFGPGMLASMTDLGFRLIGSLAAYLATLHVTGVMKIRDLPALFRQA